jgi:hypothetical protein
MPSLPAHVRLPSRVPASPPCSRLASPRLASPALPTRRTVTWPVSAVAKAWGSCRCRPAAVGAMRCSTQSSHAVWCGVLCRCVLWRDGCGTEYEAQSFDLPEKTWGYKVRMAGLREPLPTFRATWVGYNYQRIYCRGTGAHPSGLTSSHSAMSAMTW